jgi:tRNA nucleotidyltransferase/poly(A) polymerase
MKFLSHASKKLGVGDFTYVVGGAIRNWVIKQPIKDIDLVIDPTVKPGKDSEWFAKQLQRMIPTRTNLTTNNYGVAILSIAGDWDLEGHPMKGELIEIANARKESYGEGGYKPEEVVPATIEEDVIRREFTFNTLLWKLKDLAHGPDKAEIIDLTGCGLRDLQQGVMKCPRDPDVVFSDDPSRMIRAVKFTIKYGFKIPKDLEASIKKNRGKLKQIPSGHISNMLIGTFLREPTGKKALLEMKRLGLLDVLREIAEKDKSFRKALANWAEKEAKIQFLFDLMDLGMPVGNKLRFLTDSQKGRVRDLTFNMDPIEAEAFVAALKQPPVDNRALIQEFDLKGKDIAVIANVAREKILGSPDLARSRAKLTEAVRRDLSKTRKVAKGAGELHVYDFDGTLFRSPEPPVDDMPDWWHHLTSLSEPCVPKEPGSSWWDAGVVKDAKQSIADSNVHTVLLTGRSDQEFHQRVPEILRSAGLVFDQVGLNPGMATPKFKAQEVDRILSGLPSIAQVKVWDDDPKNHVAIKKVTKQHEAGYEETVPEVSPAKAECTLAEVESRGLTRQAVINQLLVRRVAARAMKAKMFKLEIGDPVLTGKYLNSKGYIIGFKSSDKNEPMVIVETEPDKKGKTKKKDVKLFKIRFDKTRERKTAAQYLDKPWLMAVRRGWKALLKSLKFDTKERAETSFDSLQTFVDNLEEQVKHIRHGYFTRFTKSDPKGKKYQASLDAVQRAIYGLRRHTENQFQEADFWHGKMLKAREKLVAQTGIAHILTDEQSEGVGPSERAWDERTYHYYPEFREPNEGYKAARGTLRLLTETTLPKEMVSLTKWFDKVMKHLYDDARFLKKKIEDSSVPYEGVDPTYTRFDLGGVKVVIDDRTVTPLQVRQYVKYLDATHQRLKAKGFGKVWYGTLFIRCEKCGGENPYGAEFGVGGNYPSGPDVVNVFMRPGRGVPHLVAHEMAHRYWYKKMGRAQRAQFAEWVDSGAVPAVSKYGKSNASEAFAEVVAFMVMGKDMSRDQLESMKAVLASGRQAATDADLRKNFDIFDKSRKLFDTAVQDNERFDMKFHWRRLINSGREVAEAVLELKQPPAGKHKQLELAARAVISPRRDPRNHVAWWGKNKKRVDFLAQTINWPDKSESGGDSLFQVGPFKVHNTIGLSGRQLIGTRRTLDAVVRKIQTSTVPPGFRKVLYGDVYITGQLAGGATLAWYEYTKDMVFVRPFKGGKVNEEHRLIHELGHRYWDKFAKTDQKREWVVHHRRVGDQSVDVGNLPDVGDTIPVKVKGVKGDPVVKKKEGGKYWFDVPAAGKVHTLSIPIRRIHDVMRKRQVPDKYPTRYSSKNHEEHFCESLALFAMGKLDGEHQTAFMEVWGPTAARVAAKYQKKKEVPKADGKGKTTVYEYSERQVANRNRDKAERVEKLRKSIGKLRSQVWKDLGVG